MARRRTTTSAVSPSRRRFLKSSLALAGAQPISSSAIQEALRVGSQWPAYILSREQDEIYIKLVALGYEERRGLGGRYLHPVGPAPLLVFEFPPQHYAEPAIDVTSIPKVFDEAKLARIKLLPSAPSHLVFRDQQRSNVRLTLRSLLDWSQWEPVMPDLDTVAPRYALSVEEPADRPFTRVELPWGIELTPVPRPKGAPKEDEMRWLHAAQPRTEGKWSLMWSTALVRADRKPAEFEVLGVRGFTGAVEQGSVTAGSKTISYSDVGGLISPGGDATIRNIDRATIAASLSRRFPYSGNAKPAPSLENPTGNPVNTALVQYDGRCASACFQVGRTKVAVRQFRISARGGWLELKGDWVPFPECAFKGWTHSASLGRDHHVELVAAGSLYPVGCACELIVKSERVFARDKEGHFVAALVKQVFLQIPQPNIVEPTHAETPFRTISVTTKRTPPLDIPPGNQGLSAYLDYDFFLPEVGQKPFPFEFVGTDWAGDTHPSAMPMIFVSNKAKSSNGLVWEPDSNWFYSQQNANCSDPQKVSQSQVIKQGKGDDGLRTVDKVWLGKPHRFAPYGGASVAVSPPGAKGDTTQQVDWIEWVRGPVPPLDYDGVAPIPFQPRARTIKLAVQGMAGFSGQNTRALATYRDTRYTSVPLLDPPPTAPKEVYNANLAQPTTDASAPYLYFLETRALIREPGKPLPVRSEDRPGAIRAVYFGTQTAGAIPDSLFESIDNEITFGKHAGSDSVGGLAVPDTHISIATRTFGAVGDATFNERRWPGYNDPTFKRTLEARARLDYAEYRLKHRKALDSEPYDIAQTPAQLADRAADARAVMGFGLAPAVAGVHIAADAPSRLNLGELFGSDAEILPGIPFSKILESVPLGGVSQGSGSGTAPAAQPDGGNAGEPPIWNVRITGIDWLLKLLGTGPGQISLPQLIALASTAGQSPETSEPIPFGIEATLNWKHETFSDDEKDLGPVKFKAGSDAVLSIDAKVALAIADGALPGDLANIKLDPSRAKVSAKATFRSFTVTVFDAIAVEFDSVEYEMSESGSKEFRTNIRSVELVGKLAFINQLGRILSVGRDSGIDIDVTSQRVKISQALQFPAPGEPPLLIGPAQVMDLLLGWSVMIPLQGRDVLSVGFSISSREKPLTIYVPPWYGGRAHFLCEATSKGLRLLEVQMEYGALIPVRWGIASGTASLCAGVFWSIQESQDPRRGGTVIFRAFVKAACDLSVAGIIQFNGMLYVALSYIKESSGREVIRGEATVSVSIKIGFIRYSYSFTATHEDERRSAQQHTFLERPVMLAAAPATQAVIPQTSSCTRMAGTVAPREGLFGSGLTGARLDAFRRIVRAYA